VVSRCCADSSSGDWPRYFAAYLGFRVAMTWLVGVWGLRQGGLWKKMPLIVVWDATAFVIWLLTFGRSSIRWRDVDYRIREGMLVPAARVLPRIPHSETRAEWSPTPSLPLPLLEPQDPHAAPAQRISMAQSSACGDRSSVHASLLVAA